MDYLMMKSDEKAILVKKEGSDDPSFVVYTTSQNESWYVSARLKVHSKRTG